LTDLRDTILRCQIDRAMMGAGRGEGNECDFGCKREGWGVR
jgi:hypothetical protein